MEEEWCVPASTGTWPNLEGTGNIKASKAAGARVEAKRSRPTSRAVQCRAGQARPGQDRTGIHRTLVRQQVRAQGRPRPDSVPPKAGGMSEGAAHSWRLTGCVAHVGQRRGQRLSCLCLLRPPIGCGPRDLHGAKFVSVALPCPRHAIRSSDVSVLRAVVPLPTLVPAPGARAQKSHLMASTERMLPFQATGQQDGERQSMRLRQAVARYRRCTQILYHLSHPDRTIMEQQ